MKRRTKTKQAGNGRQEIRTLGRRRWLNAKNIICLAFAGIMLLALGASAQHAVFNDPDVKVASKLVQAQIQAYNNALTAKSKKPTEAPTVAVPSGIQEGNSFIAQGSGALINGGTVYDSSRRIVKIVETTGGSVTSTKQFVWAGDQLCEERDATGNVTRRFFDGGEQIAGTNYFYTRDHNGSVREMTDASGNIAAQYTYGPYGEPTKLQGSLGASMQYAGMYKHERSGLNLAMNRAYSSTQGRFISRDPMDDPSFAMMEASMEPSVPAVMTSGLQARAPVNVSFDAIIQKQLSKIMAPESAQGLSEPSNSYTYAANSPINFTDRSGLQPSGWQPKFPNPWKWWRKLCRCRSGCRVTQEFAYEQCIRSGKSPILCKAIADGAFHACVAGCMAGPDLPD